MVLRSGKRKHLAIDYDRRQVRLVVFQYVRKVPSILALHTAGVPEQVNAADPLALGGVLKTVVDRLCLRGARTLMCVGRAQAVLKSLTLPPVSGPDELASMVQFQVAQELPFAADEAVVDFTHGRHWDADQARQSEAVPEGTTVLAAAVRLPVIDAARQVCEAAGLRLERLGLRPYANVRAVYRCVHGRSGERLMFVNLTADEAEIDMMCDETLEFSRAVPLAGSAANGAQAEKPPPDPRAESVRRVVTEAALSLQSFNAVQRGARIDGCLVAGATGMEKQLAAALTERLAVRCELFDPSGGFSLARGPEVSAFGAALGLAAGQAATLPFDFLNPKRPAAPKDTRKVRAAAIVAGLVVLVGSGVLARSAYLGKGQAAFKRLYSENQEKEKQNKLLQRLQDRIELVDKWRAGQLDWLGQLAHLSNTLPGAEEVYFDSIVFKPGKISLAGRAKNRESVTRFQNELMEMPGYEVRPGATSTTRDPADLGYSLKFDMEVVVSPEAEPIVTTSRPVGRPADDSAMEGARRPEGPSARPTVGRPPAGEPARSPAGQPAGPTAGQPARPEDRSRERDFRSRSRR